LGLFQRVGHVDFYPNGKKSFIYEFKLEDKINRLKVFVEVLAIIRISKRKKIVNKGVSGEDLSQIICG